MVLDILPEAQKSAFTKEDGEKVIDEKGNGLSNHPFKISDACLRYAGVRSSLTADLLLSLRGPLWS